MRFFYPLMTIAGAVVPMIVFAPWIAAHGQDTDLFVRDLFGNRVSAFFALDALLSAVVVIGMAWRERATTRFWWLPILTMIAVGVSAGLPMLLFLRERAIACRQSEGVQLLP